MQITHRKHYFWGAQFSFSSADVLCEVPYDPQLQMLFFGEEILMAVRLYTHGWDVFTPKDQLFFHLWERDYRRDSQCRVLSQLDGGAAPAAVSGWPLPGGAEAFGEAFGLGPEEAGVNFQEKRLEARALRGGGHQALRERDFREKMTLQKPPLKLLSAPSELRALSGASAAASAGSWP
eukprot:g19302.t1